MPTEYALTNFNLRKEQFVKLGTANADNISSKDKPFNGNFKDLYNASQDTCFVSWELPTGWKAKVTKMKIFYGHMDSSNVELYNGLKIEGANSASGPWTLIEERTEDPHEGWNYVNVKEASKQTFKVFKFSGTTKKKC